VTRIAPQPGLILIQMAQQLGQILLVQLKDLQSN
jgi:hypothetical protein